MGYSTPDIIIMTQESKIVDAMGCRWQDSGVTKVGGKYVRITVGRTDTAQMTLLQSIPNWWKHQQIIINYQSFITN